MKIRRMSIAYSIPKSGNTHSELVIVIAVSTVTIVAQTPLS